MDPSHITETLSQAESEAEITSLVLSWFTRLERDPELVMAPGFEHFLAKGDCQRAKESLESAFGRSHGSKKYLIAVLEAGANRVNDLRQQAARKAFNQN